jgi:hypothetical protein
MYYIKKEAWLFIWGIIALLGGNAGQFVVPLYIGWVIDDMKVGNYDHIDKYCLDLMLIVVVN